MTTKQLELAEYIMITLLRRAKKSLTSDELRKRMYTYYNKNNLGRLREDSFRSSIICLLDFQIIIESVNNLFILNPKYKGIRLNIEKEYAKSKN